MESGRTRSSGMAIHAWLDHARRTDHPHRTCCRYRPAGVHGRGAPLVLAQHDSVRAASLVAANRGPWCMRRMTAAAVMRTATATMPLMSSGRLVAEISALRRCPADAWMTYRAIHTAPTKLTAAPVAAPTFTADRSRILRPSITPRDIAGHRATRCARVSSLVKATESS
jgi:hypothetical protein